MFFLLFSCLNMAFLLYLQRILMILWILNLFTTNFISYTMAKTKQIVECVPNFSEGRDMNIIRQITDAVESVKGVKLLDVDPGEATNRTVVTFVGEPDDVVEAAFRAVGKAGQLIDMRQHHGAHPRIGATDVLPIVPVSGITLEECAEISRKLAKRIADELNIPCYCYELQRSHRSVRTLPFVARASMRALLSASTTMLRLQISADVRSTSRLHVPVAPLSEHVTSSLPLTSTLTPLLHVVPMPSHSTLERKDVLCVRAILS